MNRLDALWTLLFLGMTLFLAKKTSLPAAKANISPQVLLRLCILLPCRRPRCHSPRQLVDTSWKEEEDDDEEEEGNKCIRLFHPHERMNGLLPLPRRTSSHYQTRAGETTG